MDFAELTRRQRVSLWLDGRPGIHTMADALRFMGEVAVALRYGAATNLPLASMYRATQRQVPVPEDEQAAHARAFELTNGLLASGKAVEINVVANRLVLANERMMPAIYALRRGNTEPRVSDAAHDALDYVLANESARSGDIRRLLKAEGQRRPDSADLALAELQRELLVDRGPAGGPSHGVFYLTREGYPYRAFAPSHPQIVSTALQLSRPEAAADLLIQYLRAAVFAMRRKLVSVFHLLLSVDEVDDAIRNLTSRDVIELRQIGKTEVITYREPSLGTPRSS